MKLLQKHYTNKIYTYFPTYTIKKIFNKTGIYA